MFIVRSAFPHSLTALPHQTNLRFKKPLSITATVETQTAAAAMSKPNTILYPDIPLISRQSAASASRGNATVHRHPRLLLSSTCVIVYNPCERY